MCGGLFSVCQSERSLCCQDVPSFGNSLTKMSHLLAGDLRTVSSCVGGLFSVCQSERSLCCQDAPSFGNSLTKMSHLLAGDPRTVRSCVGVCLVSVSLNAPCVVKMFHLSATA